MAQPRDMKLTVGTIAKVLLLLVYVWVVVSLVRSAVVATHRSSHPS